VQTKTAIRKQLGRGKFTSADFAQAADVSKPVARRRLAQLVAAGVLVNLDETAKVTNVKGDQRGRPRKVYRVAGK
jgi:predicted ArsR family transcriptional regulator